MIIQIAFLYFIFFAYFINTQRILTKNELLKKTDDLFYTSFY